MAAKWICPDWQVLCDWATKCAHNSTLNDWERLFISSISDQLNYKKELSQSQVEKLEAIYAEKTK